jgi:hypothetical protein
MRAKPFFSRATLGLLRPRSSWARREIRPWSALLPDPQPPPRHMRLVEIDIPPTGRCAAPLPGASKDSNEGEVPRADPAAGVSLQALTCTARCVIAEDERLVRSASANSVDRDPASRWTSLHSALDVVVGSATLMPWTMIDADHLSVPDDLPLVRPCVF